MIKINTNELKNEIIILNSYINEYEDIKLNLFNQLKESCIAWQDGESLEFDNKICNEKQTTENLYQSLKDKVKILDFIYDKYIELGKDIICNLDKKNTILSKLSAFENEINEIIKDYNNIMANCNEFGISNQIEKILKLKDNLKEVKENFLDTFNKIFIFEQTIKEKIKSLEVVQINDFSYNLI